MTVFEAITRLSQIWPDHPIPDGLVTTWTSVLGHLEPMELESAVNAYIASSEWFPKPSQILDTHRENRRTRETRRPEWDAVVGRKVGDGKSMSTGLAALECARDQYRAEHGEEMPKSESNKFIEDFFGDLEDNEAYSCWRCKDTGMAGFRDDKGRYFAIRCKCERGDKPMKFRSGEELGRIVDPVDNWADWNNGS